MAFGVFLLEPWLFQCPFPGSCISALGSHVGWLPSSWSRQHIQLLSAELCLPRALCIRTPHARTCVSGRSFGGAGRPQHSRPCPLHAGRSPLLGESIGEGWSDLTLTLLSSSGRHLSSLSLNFKDVFRISLGSSVGARVFRAGQ